MYFPLNTKENFTRFHGYRLFISIAIALAMIILSFKSSLFIANETLIHFFIFSFFSYLLFIVGLFQTASFGIFIFTALLFLGFWVKNIIHILLEYNYLEPIGYFTFTSELWNKVYSIASIGMFSIIITVFVITAIHKSVIEVREKIIFHKNVEIYIITVIILGILTALYLNNEYLFLKLGIDSATSNAIPWIVRVGTIWTMGVLTPILLYILLYQNIDRFNKFFIYFLMLLGTALSVSSSINSRATLVLWVMPIMFSILFSKIYSLKKTFFLFLIWLSVLFISVQIANNNRYVNADEKRKSEINSEQIFKLVIDRWIGIEGLMSMVSYNNKNFESFITLATEIRNKNEFDFFAKNIALISSDKEMITSAQSKSFASLPGPIAFFYLSNSIVVLFFGLMFLVFMLFYVELFIFKISKNIFLTYMVAFSFSFSFSSFGVDIIRGFRYLFSSVIIIFLIYTYIKYVQKNKLSKVEV